MLTSTPFKSPQDVYEWLSSFINLESGKIHKIFDLDMINTLADLAGHPEKCAPSFHVAGSKGKGSVTGMITAILEASGKKTAMYSSPHIRDFRERLTIGNRFFDDEIYVSAGNELKTIVKKLKTSRESVISKFPEKKAEEPSFFELMTLWFFLCVRLTRLDAMAVETGMGGRLDASNILEPLVSVITVIEKEHTEYLGETIADIAGEKAGIIKSGRPVVLAEQKPEALAVFKHYAAINKSLLLYLPDCATVNNVNVTREGTSFSISFTKRKFQFKENHTFLDLFVPIPGEVQAKNAALAILAVKNVFPEIKENDIRKALAGFTLPSRFEKISDSPLVIIDGAHTPQSVDLCLKTFTALYGSGGILVFGCAEGKDVDSMARLCIPCFSSIIITTPGTFRKSNPAAVHAVFIEKARNNAALPEIVYIPAAQEAFEQAKNAARLKGCPILVTGSFYLAAEIKC